MFEIVPVLEIVAVLRIGAVLQKAATLLPFGHVGSAPDSRRGSDG
jgi:hypothetical protein